MLKFPLQFMYIINSNLSHQNTNWLSLIKIQINNYLYNDYVSIEYLSNYKVVKDFPLWPLGLYFHEGLDYLLQVYIEKCEGQKEARQWDKTIYHEANCKP